MDQKDILALVREHSPYLSERIYELLADYRNEQHTWAQLADTQANQIVKYNRALHEIAELGDLTTSAEAKRIATEALQ